MVDYFGDDHWPCLMVGVNILRWRGLVNGNMASQRSTAIDQHLGNSEELILVN